MISWPNDLTSVGTGYFKLTTCLLKWKKINYNHISKKCIKKTIRTHSYSHVIFFIIMQQNIFLIIWRVELPVYDIAPSNACLGSSLYNLLLLWGEVWPADMKYKELQNISLESLQNMLFRIFAQNMKICNASSQVANNTSLKALWQILEIDKSVQ